MKQELPPPFLGQVSVAGIDLLTDEGLFAACGVRIAFSGRAGGVSEAPYASLNTADHVGDDLERVLRNRMLLLEALGCAGVPFVAPNQVHGTDIVKVSAAGDVPRACEEAAAGADAVLVEASGVGALMNFADCPSLVIVAPSGRFVVAHAGWRGALAGVVGVAVRALVEGEPGADAAGAAGVAGADVAAGFNAYIGPHIHAECFEVGPEVADQFVERFGADVVERERHVSLARAVEIDLVRAGLDAGRIVDTGICTACSTDRYFSYRAEGTTGRHAAFAIRTTHK